jgi:hypothetical protein
VELVVRLGVRVLHGNVGTELDVRAECFAESVVVGQAGPVGCAQIELDEPQALRLGDLQAAVRVDQITSLQPCVRHCSHASVELVHVPVVCAARGQFEPPLSPDRGCRSTWRNVPPRPRGRG